MSGIKVNVSNNTNNNTNNKSKISEKVSKTISCNNFQNFSQSDIRDTKKKELLSALLDINQKIEGNSNTELAVDIAIGLFKLIVEEQDEIKSRQKIIMQCLKNYNDILKNYDNQSIKFNKLQELARLTGMDDSVKNKNKDKVLLNLLINRLKK